MPQPPSIRPYLEVRYARCPSFSADGRRLALLYDGPGAPQVYSLALHPGDDPDEREAWDRWPREHTFHEDRVTFCRFLPGSNRWVLYGKDSGGNEREQLLLLDLDTGHEEAVTDDPSALHVFGAVSSQGDRIAYACTARDPAHFDVHVYDRETREATAVFEGVGWNRPVAFSPDGDTLYMLRYAGNLSNELWVVPIEGGSARCILGEGEGRLIQSVSVDPRTGDLYLAEDQHTDRLRLSKVDPRTGQLEVLAEPRWGVEATAASPCGQRLAYVVNREGIGQVWVREHATGEARRLGGLPGGVVEDLTFSPDGRRLAMTLSGDRSPTNVWIAPLDRAPFEATRAPHGRIDEAGLAPFRLERFTSFDGLEVPTWVVGQGERGVIIIHGGPEGQSRPRFQAVAQYLASQGLTVFLPNVRGSAGYGRHYLGLDDVEKRMDSVKDIAALHDWIGQRGLADPERVAVMGGSYGGFMVLACVTEYPERFRCGVDFVGVANWRTFLENTGAYRRKMREAEYGNLEDHGDFLDSISPIHKVDRIRCPMFVAHGANDPRVPLNEAEQVVEALRAREVPHEFMVFPDEGHGVAKRGNRIRLYEAVAGFLEEHL